jgi:thiamine biosynthesis lipoprotein ApbE
MRHRHSRSRRPPGALARLLAPWLLLGLLTMAPAGARAAAVRLSMEAFDGRAVVEARGVAEGDAEAAAQAALEEIVEVEGLAASLPTATGEAVPVDQRLASLLGRLQSFCTWSEGANGPLGGRLYELWDAAEATGRPPAAGERSDAARSASCAGLAVDTDAATVTLRTGARLDLRHFAAGWAADRAVTRLQERGVDNGFVQVGPVQRGFGPGPEGRGWPVTLPVFAGFGTSLGVLDLRDAALAISGLRSEVHADLRTGRARDGVVAVLAVSELGVDAQGLASTLYLLDTRTGTYRAGQLEPRPSVRWLLGSGEGLPLLVDFNWTALTQRSASRSAGK